jgi:hypothetical protein
MVERNKKAWLDSKTKPVITRHGKVVARVVPKTEMKSNIVANMDTHVQDGQSSTPTTPGCMTGWRRKTGRTTRFAIARVRMSRDEHIHIQQIEGFWSLLKRGISGTHHAVSPRWLQGYVNEAVWRYTTGRAARCSRS